MADRGPYRSLYTCIQDDPDFQLLSPDARLVFYTLKFSPLGNVAGIFVYHEGTGITHSGLPRDRWRKALGQLEECRWVVLQPPVVWVRNGLRFEPGYPMSDQNKKRGVEKILCGLPSLSILKEFADSYTCEAPPGPLRDPSGTLHGPSTDPPPNKESGSRSTETEKDPERERRAREARPSLGNNGYSVGFEKLWSVAPLEARVGKGKAAAAFRKAKLEGRADEVAAVMARHVSTDSWRRDASGNRCIPNLATWISQARYDDEPAPAKVWKPPEERAKDGDTSGLASLFSKDSPDPKRKALP